MQSLSLDKLAALVNGRVLVRAHNNKIPFSVGRLGNARFQSIVFWNKPIRNERSFIDQLQNHTASCLVISPPSIFNTQKWKAAGIAVIEVKRINRAYRDLARFYRNQFPIPFVQVIGSSGKTTTTEMIGAVLNEKYPTLSTVGNTNSPIGVAGNLFRVNNTHRAVVLEAGMKALGIMRISSSMIRPTIGVVTSIHRAHLTRLGSLQKIIEAKAEILEHLSKVGTLIINWDDPTCHRFPLHRYKGEIVRFGFSEQCDIWASDIQRNGVSTSFTVHTKEFEFPCTINIIGNYNVGNALAAVAVGLKMWLSPAEIAQGLASFEPRDGRLKVHTKSNGAIIIDDNFNANPDSTRMLVDELIAMALERQLVLVLGDMERPAQDIAKYARRVHFNIGRQLAKGEFHHVLAIGKWAREYLRGALQSGFPKEKVSYYRNVRSAQDEFNKLLTPGTTVVLKASPYTDLNYLRVNSTDIL